MSLKNLAILALCFVVQLGYSLLTSPQILAEESKQAIPINKPSSDTSKVIKRGKTLPQGKYISLDEVSAQPEKFSGKNILVTGQVAAVCQAKGCWMTLIGNAPQARARITFKDYAFFVPKNAHGMKGKMSGIIKIKILSEGERKHLAEDGHVDVSEIPKAELRIIADGVELYPKN